LVFGFLELCNETAGSLLTGGTVEAEKKRGL